MTTRTRHPFAGGGIHNVYQEISSALDIKGAVGDAARRNDLIPPRLEDKVSGELGKRFFERLIRDLERGLYDPQPAYFVAVPKNSLITRPAAILSLADRIVYEAIVSVLRPRIESFLLGEDILYWPRGQRSAKRWEDFERSAIKPDCDYVVRSDITAFYESVEHERLAGAIVEATGYREVADALVDFLGRTMQSARGLPQGLGGSDALATVYLAKVDLGMTRRGMQYMRHGDDVRVAAKTYQEGRLAVGYLEAEARQLGLVLNGEKTRVLKRQTYAETVSAFERNWAAARGQAIEAKIETMAGDSDKLLAAIKETGMEQLGWDLFYHGNIDLDDAIERLRPLIEPEKVRVAERLFRDAMRKMKGQGGEFNREEFHQQLVGALVQLSAGRSTVALPYIGTLAKTYPDKTEALCLYLTSMKGVRPGSVVTQAKRAIMSQVTEWELAWIVRVLSGLRRRVPGEVVEELGEWLARPHGRWLAAVEVAKLVGARGELEQDAVVRMWNAAPSVFQVDLVVAAAHMVETASWARKFVAAAVREPIHAVAVAAGIGRAKYRRLLESGDGGRATGGVAR